MQARIGLWVSQGGRLDIRQQPPISTSMLQPDEYLIRVLYSGLNPADQKHAIYLGICDLVAGYDFAGTVVARGSDRLSLLPGALVCGMAQPKLIANQYSGLHGAHQQFLVATTKGVFPLPTQTSDAELQVLATVPVVVATAADCLFGLLGLDATLSAKNKVPLLVWGGGSAVGHAVIQFAREAGVAPILVLASPRHHEVLRRRGATRCFDYRNIDTIRHQIAVAMRELSPDSDGDGCLRLAIDATGMNRVEIQSILADASAEAHGSTGHGTARIVSTVGGPEDILKPFAAVIFGEDVHLGGGRVVRARVADGALVADKVRWAIRHLGNQFHQVPVEVLDGGWPTLIPGVTRVSAGDISFRKLVFKMPQEGVEGTGAVAGTEKLV
ncbi:uncharacterized protein EAE98_006440 [Botrytis deweyae]|uniref:Enoyl reductase (ER) domain-containing protein n=1 Tax=Botrytis deweyae TaxID=2478750 RepID=A0ABQ7IJC2_9HELO|nr:uncharacterized protein EAE98_006440 [Botrytis deweyae]KAF7926145.1 hypothetical protein EAE98_006440 [Botrytis deweyae]